MLCLDRRLGGGITVQSTDFAVRESGPEAKGADALKVIIFPKLARSEALHGNGKILFLDAAPIIRNLRRLLGKRYFVHKLGTAIVCSEKWGETKSKNTRALT